MKSIIRYLKLSGLIFIFVSLKTSGQELTWQWAESITKKGNYAWMEVQSCDLMNNIYCVAPYDTALFLPDTMFIHSQNWPQTNNNNAILRYNLRGEFIDALDLYTLPDELIFYTRVGTDDDLNIYITCSFTMRIYVQDTMINHCYSPYPYLPDGLVMKLTPGYDVVWAKLVGGFYQDDIFDSFVTKNGDIYILSHNVSDPENQIIFFEQDTVYSDVELNSISKLDKEGNMQWRKDFYGMISAYWLTQGNDGLIYYWGAAYTDIILDNDTIFHPYSSDLTASSFYAAINENGSVEQIGFVDLGLSPFRMVVNSTGERYISSSVIDTLVILEDTIIIPENEYYGFIGKYNTDFQPEWYHIIPTSGNQSLGITQLALDGENLIFSITSNDDLHIADTVIPINAGDEAFVGEFDLNGELINITRSDASIEFVSDGLVLDNCNNPVISGHYRGVAYLGPDTLHSYFNTVEDGYLAKIQRNEPYSIDIGPDTLACAEYKIQAPSEYSYFIWNDSLTYNSWLNVFESGKYTIACGDISGCWAYDTINILIHPAIEIDLGPDTTILENENIIFTIPDQYESYLWSNSVTANSITIFGESYEPGTIIQVWVQVIDEPCIVSDTVYITIKSEFGVEELINNGISVFPNPFHDEITIELMPDFERIQIYDLNGITVYELEFDQSNSKSKQVIIENLRGGIYILKIKSREQNLIQKIVKI